VIGLEVLDMPRHLSLSKPDRSIKKAYELFAEYEGFVDRFNRSAGDDLTLPPGIADALGIDESISVTLSVTGATETWFSIDGHTYCWPSDPPRAADLERQFLQAQLDPLAYSIQSVISFNAVAFQARSSYGIDFAVASPRLDLEKLSGVVA
jgi:hypothetical protein